jgi:hypothetical protein
MSEEIGSIFPTQVPEYTEAADIRKAFNLYHYGSQDAPTQSSQIIRNSIAGEFNYINNRLTTLESSGSEISQLLVSQSLNDIVQTGTYHSVESPTALLNYPTTTSGILFVYRHTVGINTFVYQNYQTNHTTTNFYWRAGYLSGTSYVWASWSLASKDGHTHNEYVSTTTLNNRVSSSLTPSRAAIVDSTGKVSSSSSISELELNQLDGISTSMTIQAQLSDKAPLVHNHDDLYHKIGVQPKIFVTSQEPSGASVGDLWIY